MTVLAAIEMAVRGPLMSKHRQYSDGKRGGKKLIGKCYIMPNSGIRKRMRAARRPA